MKKILGVLGILTILADTSFAASEAMTTKVQCPRGTANSYNILDGVALNAAAGSRTLTLAVNRNWAKVRVGVFMDRTAITDLTLTVTESMDEGATYFAKGTRTCLSGTCESDALVDKESTTSADFLRSWEYDVRGLTHFKIVFAGTSAGASDLIYVQACFISGE